MKQITYEITNPLGMHARPAAFVAQACVALPSQITIKCEGKVITDKNAPVEKGTAIWQVGKRRFAKVTVE